MKNKWTNKMYKAYYGMSRKELANLVHKEIYGVDKSIISCIKRFFDKVK